jgi:hypothetical protein
MSRVGDVGDGRISEIWTGELMVELDGGERKGESILSCVQCPVPNIVPRDIR